MAVTCSLVEIYIFVLNCFLDVLKVVVCGVRALISTLLSSNFFKFLQRAYRFVCLVCGLFIYLLVFCVRGHVHKTMYIHRKDT